MTSSRDRATTSLDLSQGPPAPPGARPCPRVVPAAAVVFSCGSYVAHVTEVSVVPDGKVRVHKLTCAAV